MELLIFPVMKIATQTFGLLNLIKLGVVVLMRGFFILYIPSRVLLPFHMAYYLESEIQVQCMTQNVVRNERTLKGHVYLITLTLVHSFIWSLVFMIFKN